METKEYFEKVMQGFRSAMPLGSSKNQHRNGRSLGKYCQDEGIDYKWLQEYKRTYPNETKPVQESELGPQSFIPLVIEEEKTQPKSVWHKANMDIKDINIRNLQSEIDRCIVPDRTRVQGQGAQRSDIDSDWNTVLR